MAHVESIDLPPGLETARRFWRFLRPSGTIAGEARFFVWGENRVEASAVFRKASGGQKDCRRFDFPC